MDPTNILIHLQLSLQLPDTENMEHSSLHLIAEVLVQNIALLNETADLHTGQEPEQLLPPNSPSTLVHSLLSAAY